MNILVKKTGESLGIISIMSFTRKNEPAPADVVAELRLKLREQ